MTNIGGQGIDLWDEADEFFYDVLCLPDGRSLPLKVRSMVGLIPLFAVEVLEPELLAKVPEFTRAAGMVPRTTGPTWPSSSPAGRSRAAAKPAALAAARASHEAPAQAHARRNRIPLRLRRPGPFALPPRPSVRLRRPTASSSPSSYQPGESDSGLFGGNSNWRGPIWMPVNFLHHRVAAAVPHLLRRRLQGRMPDRLGQRS